MTGYIIKTAYIEGNAKGRSYLIDKRGYVRDADSCFFKDDVYKTKKNCETACKRKKLDLELDISIKKKTAKPGSYIPDQESFEPFEVEYHNDI